MGKRKRGRESSTVRKKAKRHPHHHHHDHHCGQSNPNTALSLYLMYNDCADVKTRTYIDYAEDVLERLLQHNGIIEGAPRQTRKAQGHWKLLCILLVPPRVREQISTKQLKELWRSKSRGAERRIKKGVQLSEQFGLYCFLSESLLQPDRQNSLLDSENWELSELVQQYHAQHDRRQLIMSAMQTSSS